MQERNTPLHLAVAKECNEKIVTALLWAGAEKNALNQAGQTRYVSTVYFFARHLLPHESSLMTKRSGELVEQAQKTPINVAEGKNLTDYTTLLAEWHGTQDALKKV